MSKDILPNLKIKIPSSTNPIPFFNNTGLDSAFSREITKLFKEREITFGILPEMEEKRKIYEDIVKRFGSVDDLNLQFTLFDTFNVFDPSETKQSKWMLTPFKSIVQPESIEVKKKGAYQNTGTIITHKGKLSEGVSSVTARLKPGSEGEAGLVFNYKNNQDFWVASYRNDQDNPVKNAFIIKRVLYGNVAEYGKGVPIPHDFTNLVVSLSIENNANGSANAILKKENSQQGLSIDLRNIKITTGSSAGFYSQNSKDAEYFSLEANNAGNTQILFPFETDIDKLTNERYERGFDVYNIDLRPNNWLSLFKRLWAEKYFAKRKLENVQMIYNDLFKVVADKPAPSPEEIDNVEGRVKQHFDEYLRAENKYQEFSSFMSSAGASVPEEPQNDDFLSVFNNTTAIGTIKQQVFRNSFTTWKEFFVTKAYLKPGTDVSGLITKTKRTEIINSEGEEAWGMYVRSTLKPFVLWDVIERVPHYKFVLDNIGDSIETADGLCMISHKFWKTNHTSRKQNLVIEISNPNKVTEKINEILEGDTTDGSSPREHDTREYRNNNGEYVDQYGIPLQDHVIALTERQDPSVSNILIIPSFESDKSLSPDSILIVKDPIFSGKQLHSPSIQFFEKFVMDVQWDGIGLGEFSHSVNLFPGEQRELKIVTSKKRSWETVSKSKSSSKASNASESAQASKRNDSFSSKLADSLDSSSSFARSGSSSSSFGANVSASGGFGAFSASASANYSSQSSEQSSSNLSSVAKKASEVASQSGSEVSQNNKVSFSSTTETEQSLESKMAGEDMETETSVIKIYNINEGRTANYNFFQVTNIYNSLIKIEDCAISINTGVEIIPGTGITISKRFELENFPDIMQAFPLYSAKEKNDIFKIIAAQIVIRYLKLTGDAIGDDPKILVPDKKEDQKKLKLLRNACLKTIEDTNDESATPVVRSAKSKLVTLADRLPDELLDLRRNTYKIEGFDLETKNTYTVNSGKYYVESLLGVMPATEEYLEERRKIETDKQNALVNELKERTKSKVFFPEFPDNLQSLSVDNELVGKINSSKKTNESTR